MNRESTVLRLTERNQTSVVERRRWWRALKIASVTMLGIAFTLTAVSESTPAAETSPLHSSVPIESSPPQPVTATMSITNVVDSPGFFDVETVISSSESHTATVVLTAPDWLALTGTPPTNAFDAVSNTLTWSGVAIAAGVPMTITEQVSVANTISETLIASVLVAVHEDSPTNRLLGQDSHRLRVGLDGLMNLNGATHVDAGEPYSDPYFTYDEPIWSTLSWEGIPTPGERVTATVRMTGTASFPVAYDGSFSIPTAWTFVGGEASYAGTLSAGEVKTHTVFMDVTTTAGPWELVATVSPSGFDGTVIRTRGEINSSGLTSLLGQIRTEDPSGGGSNTDFFSPLSGVGLASTQGLDAIDPFASVCGTATFPHNEFWINGTVTAGKGPASNLKIELKWFSGSTSFVPPQPQVEIKMAIFTLDPAGSFNQCFPIPVTDDFAYVWYDVFSTDETFFTEASTYVYSDKVISHSGKNWYAQMLASIGTNRKAFVVDGEPKSFNLLKASVQEGVAAVQLAAHHALHTRSFLSTYHGIDNHGTGGHLDVPYRAIAYLIHKDDAVWQEMMRIGGTIRAGAAYFPDYYMQLSFAQTATFEELGSLAHHEFGHIVDNWMHGGMHLGSNSWKEGWADAFNVVVANAEYGGGMGRARYNQSLPVECVPCSPLDPSLNPVENELAVAGALWDLWDPNGNEVYVIDGETIEMADPAWGPDAWIQAWDLISANPVVHPCDFPGLWDGQPFETEAITVLEEHGFTGAHCAQ